MSGSKPGDRLAMIGGRVKMPQVILGLGSNLADRGERLAMGRRELDTILSSMRASRLYESAAVLTPGAPPEWNLPYLNQAVIGETTLAPGELLERVKAIEARHGRQARGLWAPREIDIDILAYGEQVVSLPDLTVPHVLLAERDFALLPLADLAPDWRFPAGPHAGETAARIAQAQGYAPGLRLRPVNGTRLAGILNLTPDSFSDGGLHTDTKSALSAIEKMQADGADLIDVGAESTRPGANSLSPEAEWERLKPVLSALRGEIAFSIDTRHAATAMRSLEMGASWINDVGGFQEAAMIRVAAESDCRLVVVHSLSIPADRSIVLPAECDPVTEVLVFGRQRLQALQSAGIGLERIIFDPGIGFGKTSGQSLALLRGVERLRELRVPLLIGHSRKSFLGDGNRDEATLCVSQQLAADGIEWLRVHDVARHRRMLNLTEALIS